MPTGRRPGVPSARRSRAISPAPASRTSTTKSTAASIARWSLARVFRSRPITPLKGFKILGGDWRIQGEELHFSGTAGDKLVSELPAFDDGEVGVEVFVPDRHSSNAGLIVRVADPKMGTDDFDGYEIALNAAAQNVRLGRHRHNWELIKDMPCAVPVGQWVPLAVKLEGRTIEVFVNGRSVLRHDDGDATLSAGTIGLRQFQPNARYRNLWVKTGGKMRTLPFASDAAHPCEVSGLWRPVQTGSAAGVFTLETDRPFVGRQAQRLTFVGGQGKIGVENQGLNRWGMHFAEGKPYEGVLWARADAPVEMLVALENKDGSQTLAEERLAIKPGDWRRLSFTLTPKAPSWAGLAITLRKPGSVVLGYAFLQPADWGRFHGLPVRRDVAEGLVDQGITVLRYGGSMVNHAEYRWKKMIGPRDRRPPYRGTWYPYSTNGWGILDFLDFCAAAGFWRFPTFNVNETPQDMADFIEYVNGPASSEWGRRRAVDGHPEPYNLRISNLATRNASMSITSRNSNRWPRQSGLATHGSRSSLAISPTASRSKTPSTSAAPPPASPPWRPAADLAIGPAARPRGLVRRPRRDRRTAAGFRRHDELHRRPGQACQRGQTSRRDLRV